MNEGFFKTFYSMLEWEWYKDKNTKCYFLHCLLKANWKDADFKGYKVPRGSFVSSLPKIAEDLDMTTQEVRTAEKHLISTGEITVKSTSKFRIITVNNYEKFQSSNRQDNRQVTDNQQTSNRQSTAIEEYKTIRQEEQKEESNNTPTPDTKPKSNKKKANVTVDELIPMVNEKNYSNELKEMLTTWLKYRVEIKDPVKSPTSFSRTLGRVDKAVTKYGEKALIDLIDYGIGKEWHGIIFERLEEGGANNDRRGDGAKVGGAESTDRREPEYGTVEYYKSIGWKA
jgi:hypothetical protein